MNKLTIGVRSKFISYCMKKLKMTKEEATKAYNNAKREIAGDESFLRWMEKGYNVSSMFVWDMSHEGHAFWHQVAKRNYN